MRSTPDRTGLPPCILRLLLLLMLSLGILRLPAEASSGVRQSIPLSEGWGFRIEDAPDDAWKAVEVPSTFEDHAGHDFDGVGLYRISVDAPDLPPGTRAMLHIDAAATEATVVCDGEEVGHHLGGWSPFRVDLTRHLRARTAGEPIEILIRVDEKVGHNTQGFLPIIEPHFGGLWQPVTLQVVPQVHFDDLNVLAVGDPRTGHLRVEAPLVGAAEGRVALSWRRLGEAAWSEPVSVDIEGEALRAEVQVPDPKPWSPEEPNLYEVRLQLDGEPGDEIVTRAAFRSIEVEGDGLRLNGRPLSVRGLLNWGYYPPGLAPIPDEGRFRNDLEFARERGFNLMKFCLWVPPKRYLELCDELGMFAWMEYPTWHPQLDQAHRADLLREFAEFFAFDRNHPSVILRSLTCETGPSADLEVVTALYDLAHAMIPGAVVEDDSSWIGWQRVHDFYDDHPYGNNHTWVETLERLKAHIAERSLKPLVLGEAIAADTWLDRDAVLELYGSSHPYWFPGFFDANAAWTERLLTLYGSSGLDRLIGDSKHYAMLMRKYQIEAFRREVPRGGYVVSVIRDFPLAGMGLIDYMGRPKWSPEDWAWQGDTMLLLETPNDRRAFTARELAGDRFALGVSHFGRDPIQDAPVSLEVQHGADRTRGSLAANVSIEPGSLRGDVIDLPATRPSIEVDSPQRWTIRGQLDGGSPADNSWPVWAVPEPEVPGVRLHATVDAATAALFPIAQPLVEGPEEPGEVIVARRFDARLLGLLEAGARVLMLPDGEKGSFALANHWFLRGGPYLPDHPIVSRVPRDLLVELQHFDLAGPVIPRIDAHLEEVDPVLLLWDNHDLAEVRTHGLVFESKVGRGRLLVSALSHGPADDNAAGRWLLGILVDHLATGPEPRRAFGDSTLDRLRSHLDARAIDLADRFWRFRPDPRNQGLAFEWHLPGAATADGWEDIRIDRHWESQGHETLDGWAWYRTKVEIPESWAGRDVFVSFRGVDDHYELYVDGKLAGSGGDIATRRTAFEDRVSHRVTELVEPGQASAIAVRVYDWYGAGGIFRPVTIGTAPIGPEADWIR